MSVVRLGVLALAALLCAWVPVMGNPAPAARSLGAMHAPTTPEGLPAYVGSPSAPALLQHRVDTVALGGPTPADYVHSPAWLAYDHGTESFFVAAPPNEVDVVPFDGGLLQVQAAVPVGEMPFGVAVDNVTQEVFVSNSGSDNVSVLSTQTDAVLGSVAVGSSPYGVAFDPRTADVYVANGGSDSVSVLSPGSLSVVATVGVGSDPLGIAYDPITGDLFVADHGSGQVTVLAPSGTSVLATVTVGSEPYGVAVDNATDDVYVTNEGSSNVSVISAATDRVVATVPVVYPTAAGDLQGIAYDPRDGYLWAGAGAFYAVVIDPATESFLAFVNTDPSGVVFDPDSGDVCVTNTANVTFECFLFPRDSTPAVPVDLEETGLPPGTVWSVNLSDAYSPGPYPLQSSNSSTIAFSVLGRYAQYVYDAHPTDGYFAIPASGRIETRNLASVSVNVSYFAASALYVVTFSESGLPSGTTWYANLSDGQTLSGVGPTLSTSLPDGAYAYTVASTDPAYAAPSGRFSIDGAAVAVPVPFSEEFYTATFEESGLPAGMEWSVTVAGYANVSSSSSSAALALPNGSYSYVSAAAEANWSGSGGGFRVAGADLAVPVWFHANNASVTISESGLPSSVLASHGWTVFLHGVANHTTTSLADFAIPNGSYALLVTGPPGYSANGSGRLTVAGTTREVVTFEKRRPATLTFKEVGLRRSQRWCVQLDGAVQCTTTRSLSYPGLGAGAYAYGVLSPLAHETVTGKLHGVAVGPSGSIDVGGSAKLTLRFVYPYRVTFTPVGLAGGNWSVTLGGTTQSGSASSVLSFELPNGTYGYRVGRTSGYLSRGSPSRVVVRGSPENITVLFTPRTDRAHPASGGPVVALGGLGVVLLGPSRRTLAGRAARVPRLGGPRT